LYISATNECLLYTHVSGINQFIKYRQMEPGPLTQFVQM